MNGKYTFVAVSTALSNALSKPGRTPKKYPDKPFSLDNQANSEDMTIEAKKKVANALFHKLQIMKVNFDMQKKARKEAGE